jgi:hypothetical protein
MVVAFLTGLFISGSNAAINLDITRNVFQDVISDSVEHFSLRSLEIVKVIKPYQASRYNRPASPPKEEIDNQNSRNVATLLSNCLELGLHNELERACAKLTAEVEISKVDLFGSVYLPLLKDLSAMIRGNESSPALQSLFQDVLSTYIVRFVKAEPTPPQDWKRRTTNCNCADCQALNRYLASPMEKVGRFAMGMKRRQHLESQLPDKRGFATETVRSGNPQVLVITKTNAIYVHERTMWTERCNVALAHIQSIGEETLRKLLGDKFDSIWSLSYTKAMEFTSKRPAPLSAIENFSNGRILPPITKRKTPTSVPADADVIELD